MNRPLEKERLGLELQTMKIFYKAKEHDNRLLGGYTRLPRLFHLPVRSKQKISTVKPVIEGM